MPLAQREKCGDYRYPVGRNVVRLYSISGQHLEEEVARWKQEPALNQALVTTLSLGSGAGVSSPMKNRQDPALRKP
jgi:hypothetical protein